MMQLVYVCVHYVWQSDPQVANCTFTFYAAFMDFGGVYIIFENSDDMWAQEYNGKCDMQMCAKNEFCSFTYSRKKEPFVRFYYITRIAPTFKNSKQK